jgi:hypothetical protein
MAINHGGKVSATAHLKQLSVNWNGGFPSRRSVY